ADYDARSDDCISDEEKKAKKLLLSFETIMRFERLKPDGEFNDTTGQQSG
ncbi:hypothetical protein A2U01_0087036, partial [Trifolium medium]|nr:hypothetical protein [Trifolium medium]